VDTHTSRSAEKTPFFGDDECAIERNELDSSHLPSFVLTPSGSSDHGSRDGSLSHRREISGRRAPQATSQASIVGCASLVLALRISRTLSKGRLSKLAGTATVWVRPRANDGFIDPAVLRTLLREGALNALTLFRAG
jgi:hypothetical protein